VVEQPTVEVRPYEGQVDGFKETAASVSVWRRQHSRTAAHATKATVILKARRSPEQLVK
jgi:hypothetical protein